jgi:hypothetical protein
MESAKESETYTFLDMSNDYSSLDTLPIKILVDPYKDVEFRFTKISVKQENEELSVIFDTELLKVPEGKKVSINDNMFIDFLGDILYDIVVNRTDITAEVNEQVEPVDLEADVHEDTNGKNYS